jgi:hypothetical protein
MQKHFFILTMLIFSAFTILKAQQPSVITSNKPGWHKIGEKIVDFKADKDEIIVLGADKFKAIQLKVTDARIHMEDINVVYDLPGISETFKEDVAVRSDFKAGDRTRIIYLKYPCLKMNKIVFVYRTVPNWKYEKAHVEVYGLK